jgi:hypothetical protein
MCLISSPGRVRGLNWAQDSTAGLEWLPTLGATFYNVYRGEGADLAQLLDGQTDSCRATTTTLTATGEILAEAPAPGSFIWYLVRAATAGGEGSAGDATTGPRVQDSVGPCP